MRKNRFNNGYIGINRLDDIYNGVVSIEKYNDIRDYPDTSISYIRPNNGNGYGARATAYFINGTINSVDILNRGGSYASTATITFSGGGGTGATGYATRYTSGTGVGKVAGIALWHTVKEVRIVHPGIGYTSTPTVTFSAPDTGGTTATGTAVISGGKLVAINITNPGSRYITAPTISLSSAGASTLPVVVPIIQCGTGYTEPPTITFSGGNTAIAICRLAGQLGNITLTSGGTGYTEPPTAFIKGYNSISLNTSVSAGSVVGITHNSSTEFISPIEVIIGGWVPLPTLTTQDEKLVAAYKVTNTETNPVAFRVAGNYTVDWGNGLVQNFNSGVTATYNYNEAEYAGLTLQDPFLGHKTVLITITPQAGHGLTLIDLDRRHPTVGPNTSANGSGWLDIAIAGATLSTLAIGALSPRVTHRNLEQFSYIGRNSITAWSYMFNNVTQLRKIGELDLSVATGTTNLFANCYSLTNLPDTFVSTKNISNSNGMFNSCYSLRKIPDLECDNMNNVSSFFSSCFVLERLPNLKNFSPNNTCANMFFSCHNLVEIPYLDFSRSTDLSSLFQNCVRLQKVPPLPCNRTTTTASMFNNCVSLKEIPYLDISNSTSMSNMFNNCYNLTSVPFLDTSKIDTASGAFTNCYALKFVPSMDLRRSNNNSQMFQSTYSLQEIPNAGRYGTSSQPFTSSGIFTTPYVTISNSSNVFNLYSSAHNIRYISGVNIIGFGSGNLFSSAQNLVYVENIDMSPAFDTNSTLTNQSMFESCSRLEEINGLTFGSTSGTSAYTTIFNNANGLRKINMYGVNQNITLPNPSMLGPTALNNIYTNLATVGASGANAKTITVTGSWGTVSDNPMIAISKGWAVTG